MVSQQIVRYSTRGRAAAVIATLVVVSLLAVALIRAQAPGAAAIDARIEPAVRAAILVDMTVAIPPPGNSAGHLSETAMAELRSRLEKQLPKIYTGSLLTTKLDRLSAYVTALQVDENQGWNTAAGINDLRLETVIVDGPHSTVQGEFDVWVKGLHLESGAPVPDDSQASYVFTAGLDLVGSDWRVSSWEDHQTS